MKIGIVGQGFVGSAIREGLKNFYEVLTYDIDESKCNSTHEDVCNNSEIIFVCIPTPMRRDGSCDTRLLETVVMGIEKTCSYRGKDAPVLVVKSTVPPGTTARINKMTETCPVVFSPEFLTEANSFEDFKNQTRIVLGDDPDENCISAKKVKQMFRKAFPDIPIVITKHETAEMVKYFTNCFLASKVIFANQMYEMCKAANIDYDKVVEYALYDKRIGTSHLSVPGPDGDLGFGGHCFPKDLAAMIYFAKSHDLYPNFLMAVEESNSIYRTDKDWEAMKGRAVSED